MLALFVNVPKDPQFSADSKYSADHGPLLSFPHFSAGQVCKPKCKQTLQQIRNKQLVNGSSS